ncbi:MAG: hypothetical protein OQJ89_06025 [Kangiellaceae bacterium]|nr:hypothetical protein [Kangiellaceae bacterium]MCW8997443.1 hypothetical protein [Kangiellaceae bacterium]MCW9016499.1 hypothetical protein [Kangiellaceae bacterium]
MKSLKIALIAISGLATIPLFADDSLKSTETVSKIETQAAVARTFYYPKRANQYGQVDYIFINATNGTQFCKEQGYYNATAGSILCGEDESSYTNFDWYSQSWKAKSTGSKNQCYPLYRTITCK